MKDIDEYLRKLGATDEEIEKVIYEASTETHIHFNSKDSKVEVSLKGCPSPIMVTLEFGIAHVIEECARKVNVDKKMLFETFVEGVKERLEL